MPHSLSLPPNSLKLLYKLNQVRGYSRIPSARGEQERLLGLVYTGLNNRVQLQGRHIERCDDPQVAAATIQLWNRAHQMEIQSLPVHDESELKLFAEGARSLGASLEYHILEDVPYTDPEHPHYHYGAYAAHGPRNPHLFLLSPASYIKAKHALERIRQIQDTVGIRYNWIPLDPKQEPSAHEMYNIIHPLATPAGIDERVAAAAR